MNDYFKNDEYWKEHIKKQLEEDNWLDEYRKYFSNSGLCLDLGCGIGQYTKKIMSYGYTVVSADISKIALNVVKKFNNNVIEIDMQNSLPFDNNKFDIVFANLSIHYFDDKTTKNLMNEIKRILKKDGLFIGSVNGIQGLKVIKDTSTEIEPHYYYNKNKYIRLFDKSDLKKYLSPFQIIEISEKEIIRFNHQKNYLLFICKKG